MKIFKILQRQYAILGISPSISLNSFKKRVLFGFLMFGYLFISGFVYTSYVANDFMEYVECCCALSACVIIFVCYAAVAFRKTILFDGIDNIERFIDTRKAI